MMMDDEYKRKEKNKQAKEYRKNKYKYDNEYRRKLLISLRKKRHCINCDRLLSDNYINERCIACLFEMMRATEKEDKFTQTD